MTKVKILTVAIPLFFSALAGAFALSEELHFQQGDITVENPVARASIGKTENSAAFMTIYNGGAGNRVLVAARSPISEKVELHRHLMRDGVMMMREVEGGIEVPAGGETVLESGGLHIMLLGLRKPLSEGEHFPLTLVFANGEEFTLPVAVHDVVKRNNKTHHHL